MSKRSAHVKPEYIERFIKCNSRMREATLESEQAFLKLAGNISAAQLQMILAIGDNAPCTMSILAKILHFSKANITQMVDRLIQKKFVRKTRRQDDQRIVDVELLQKGQHIYDLNKAHVERVAKNWFSKMTDHEKEAMLTMWENYLNDQ